MNEIFKKRRSVRKFTDQEVSKEQIRNILCAAMVSPSGNHVNPWEFLVVRDKEKLSKLGDCGQWQRFVADCNVAIVIIAKEDDTDMWLEDCSVAAAYIYLEVANQGLGSCWAKVRGGKTPSGEDREEYVKGILDIPSEYRVLNVMAIGYTDQQPPLHSEDEYKESKVHNDVYGS
jgi:nitroreductase